MSLPLELQKLPPQALDVIRYLDGRDSGADVATILWGTGLSERALGKAIRRLVTRYYVQLLGQGVYALTQIGKQAAQEIRAYDTGTPGESPAAVSGTPAVAAPAERHPRRLSVWVAHELVVGMKAMLLVGFNAPVGDSIALQQPARLVLRLSAPGCDVEPVERPLDVAVERPAGPVQFRVVPRREGLVRIKIEADQLVTLHELVPLGGIYFDLRVSLYPTPHSAKFHALGAPVGLVPGQGNPG
jgi:hypothetical protein